jgi:hypothetical protein
MPINITIFLGIILFGFAQIFEWLTGKFGTTSMVKDAKSFFPILVFLAIAPKFSDRMDESMKSRLFWSAYYFLAISSLTRG